jgi:outer membrane protein OmpA-like peptidoglycan-associated protein
MSISYGTMRLRFACAALGTVLLFAAGGSMVSAEEPDLTAQIINALTPKTVTLTRGLSTGPRHATAEQDHVIDSLPTNRSLSAKERQEAAAATADKPSIDLEIYFDFGSADVGEKAMPTVDALGRALTSAELKGGRFMVAGHTDAKGSASYNQRLSQRRAEAVKRALMEKFGLHGKDLVTVGYGKERLKNTADPLAAENRRVQIVNLNAGKTAERQ